MITVTIDSCHIAVAGHARAAPPGQDIVCAAVSVLVQTLVRSIEDLTEDEIQYNLQPGRAEIRYGDLSEKSRTLIDSFFVGICGVAEAHPEKVAIV